MLVYLYLDTQEFSTEQIPILFELFNVQKSLSVCVCVKCEETKSEKKNSRSVSTKNVIRFVRSI